MSINWYTLSLIALVLMGMQRFLYKISAQRGCNSAWTTFTFMGTVTIISSIFFLSSPFKVPDISILIIVTLVNSLSFTLGTLTHMESLKHLPANITYPIIRLNAGIVVIFSIIFFHDYLSIFQGIGIVISISTIVMLARDADGKELANRNVHRGLLLVIICMITGAIASISSKFAAMHTDKMAFMALSYFIGTILSFALRNRLETENREGIKRDAVIIGVTMGLLNFAGFYSFLSAISIGPLSIVISIMGLYFIIPIILSRIIYSERFTKLRVFGLIMTVVSVILLRM